MICGACGCGACGCGACYAGSQEHLLESPSPLMEAALFSEARSMQGPFSSRAFQQSLYSVRPGRYASCADSIGGDVVTFVLSIQIQQMMPLKAFRIKLQNGVLNVKKN